MAEALAAYQGPVTKCIDHSARRKANRTITSAWCEKDRLLAPWEDFSTFTTEQILLSTKTVALVDFLDRRALLLQVRYRAEPTDKSRGD
jgi:hypothetical protein